MDAKRLAEIRQRLDGITAGPWFFNSYSAIFSAPYQKVTNELEDLHEAAGSPWDDKGNYPEPWKTEQKHCEAAVAWVPARYGDTAVGRHQADAEFIENAPDDMRDLLAALEKVTIDCIGLEHAWSGANADAEMYKEVLGWYAEQQNGERAREALDLTPTTVTREEGE